MKWAKNPNVMLVLGLAAGIGGMYLWSRQQQPSLPPLGPPQYAVTPPNEMVYAYSGPQKTLRV